MVKRRSVSIVAQPPVATKKSQAVALSLPPLSVAQALRRTFVCAVLAFAFGCWLMAAAWASSALPYSSPESDALYAQLLSNPTDRKANLTYSAMMSRGGDFEAAIPPLERILVSEPNNAWLMLQLGTLYQALGSNIMARTYLTRAMAEPSASDSVKEQSETMLRTLH